MRRPALALLLGCLLLVAGASALDGYDYYQTIEYAGCDQDVYQQDVVIHRTTGTAYEEAAGPLRIWHIYVGDHCREDYGDVRFTNSTGELAYYLWPDYDSSSARFCVRLEGADADGTLTVWYGNASAATTSDGNGVYRLIDHFDSGSLNTSVWSHIQGDISFSGSNLVLTGTKGTRGLIESISTFDTSTMIQAKIKHPAAQKNAIGMRIPGDFNNRRFYLYGSEGGSNNIFQTWDDGVYTATTGVCAYIPDEYSVFSFIYDGNSKAYVNGVLSCSHSLNIDTNLECIVLYEGSTVGISYIDYVLARAYSATPPAALTFSGEQETAAVLQPFPGLTLIPRDLTGNGLYTDINGNGRLDYNDLTIFFQNLAWAKTAQPIACFDFNGNGWLDYNDVITLFSTIMEVHP